MSTRQNIATWQPHGRILRGWARCASGDIAEGIAWIEDGIGNYRAAGAIVAVPFFLALKAQAFHLANRTSEALDVINEAEALSKDLERSYGVSNCTDSAVCFSRPLVLMPPGLKLLSVRRSGPRGSRSRFPWRNARKEPTRNTVVSTLSQPSPRAPVAEYSDCEQRSCRGHTLSLSRQDVQSCPGTSLLPVRRLRPPLENSHRHLRGYRV